jgi:hypothetical protein
MEILRRGIERLGPAVAARSRSNWGPSQCEFTFRPQFGLDTADYHGAVPRCR